MKTDDDLRDILLKECGDSQANWAKEHGFSPQYINRVINGGAHMTEKIARVLGYEYRSGWAIIKKKRN